MGRLKPPDFSHYRVIKTSMRSIALPKLPSDILSDAVSRANQLISLTSMFIRSFILFKVKNKQSIPDITPDFIKMAFKVCAASSKMGRKPGEENNTILSELSDFHRDQFSSNFPTNFNPVSAHQLSHIIGYAITTMITSFETNVKEHFFHHLYRFVNLYFKSDIDRIVESAPYQAQKNIKNTIYKELAVLKNDLVNNTNFSHHKDWLLKYRPHILPKLENTNLTYELLLQMDPQKFLPCLIFMASYLEEKALKSFQIFPLRTESVPKYIQIDTTILIELFHNNNLQYLSDIEKYKEQIWSEFFDLKGRKFKQKGYVFDYAISTDNIGVSIRFIKPEQAEIHRIKKIKMREARKESFSQKKNCTRMASNPEN